MAGKLCKSFGFVGTSHLNERENFFHRKTSPPPHATRSEGVLESESRMPNIPRKLSSISFRNAVIDYWKYRIEYSEQVMHHVDALHRSAIVWSFALPECLPPEVLIADEG